MQINRAIISSGRVRAYLIADSKVAFLISSGILKVADYNLLSLVPHIPKFLLLYLVHSRNRGHPIHKRGILRGYLLNSIAYVY